VALASLQRLREWEPQRRRGRGRYLLELNTALGRSLRTRYARGRRQWTKYDGVVLEESERAILSSHRLRARPYSATALERFAACPYQFYLASVLRLESRRSVTALHTLDPLTRGHLVHEILASCTRALLRAGGFPRSASGLQRAWTVLDGVLEEVEPRYRDRLAPAVERLWREEIAQIRADLRGWLAAVAHGGGEWQPAYVELGFGFGPGAGRDPASRAEPVRLDAGWQLHGVVDLVERQPHGPGVRVTDYKTGRYPPKIGTTVGRGGTLQPVLYGLAVEALLGEPVLESRLLFCTSAARYTARPITLGAEPAGARRAGQEVLEIIDRALELGFLPPAPREGTCARCDFLSVCGPNEERRRKDRTALGDLDHLRGMR
jgi:hypothetical protein